MKRKRPSVEIRKSDQPKKRMRDTAMRILLPTDLVRRISEFVLELTHVQYVESLLYHTSKNSLTYPLFEIDTVDNTPYQHIPNDLMSTIKENFPKIHLLACLIGSQNICFVSKDFRSSLDSAMLSSKQLNLWGHTLYRYLLS